MVLDPPAAVSVRIDKLVPVRNEEGHGAMCAVVSFRLVSDDWQRTVDPVLLVVLPMADPIRVGREEREAPMDAMETAEHAVRQWASDARSAVS